MHVLVSLIVFLLVAVELFSEEAVPVSFEFSLRSLSEELTFELSEVLLILVFKELQVVIDLTEPACWGYDYAFPCLSSSVLHSQRGCSETGIGEPKCFAENGRVITLCRADTTLDLLMLRQLPFDILNRSLLKVVDSDFFYQ